MKNILGKNKGIVLAMIFTFILVGILLLNPVSATNNSSIVRIDIVEYVNSSTSVSYSSSVRQSFSPENNLSDCYSLLGVQWANLPINYSINPNGSSLKNGFVVKSINKAAQTWNRVTGRELFGYNIVNYSIPNLPSYGIGNTITFYNLGNIYVLAQTSLYVNTQNLQITEFNTVFNTAYPLGNARKNSSVYDMQSVATHELGHALGLQDVTNTNCANVTMFYQSTPGNIGPRTLAPADIAGVRAIYDNQSGQRTPLPINPKPKK